MTASELNAPGAHVVANSGSELHGFAGVYFFSRGRSLVVSAPPKLVGSLAASAEALMDTSIMDREALRRVVGIQAGVAIGPAFQGLLESANFTPSKRNDVIDEVDVDLTALGDLRTASGEAAWGASGISKVTGQVAVAVEQDQVVGVAGLRHREEGVVDPCVLVQPDRRGRGLATDLVGRVVQTALDEDTLVLYQTLLGNTSAVRVAERVGFDHYATTVAVRLAGAE